MNSPPTSTDYDLSRGQRQAMLDDLFFETAYSVSGTATKAVLRAVESFGRNCYATNAAIARRANVSPRVAERALQRLQTSDALVASDRRRNPAGTITSHRAIDWAEVRRRGQSGPPLETSGPPPVADKLENGEKPPLTRPRPAAVAGILQTDSGTAIADQLSAIGLHRSVPAARKLTADGVAIDQVVEAVRTYRANQAVLDGPGSVLAFLRDGVWPAEGVRDPDQIEQNRRVMDESSAKRLGRERLIDRLRGEGLMPYEVAEWIATNKPEYA